MNPRPTTALAVLAFAGLGTAPQEAPAGPPLICWEIAIGEAKSLPWGDQPMSRKPDYDVGRLVEDTLALLGPDTPVLVRMETLRRATLYASRHGDAGARGEAAAWELAARLFARALDGETSKQPDAHAWFDAGYFVAACRQADGDVDFDGYRWATRGRTLAGGTHAEMDFGLALMTALGDPERLREVHEKHLGGALAGARDGSLLAKNLLAHLGRGAKTLDEMRAALATRSG
jgi:hypothetical protein